MCDILQFSFLFSPFPFLFYIDSDGRGKVCDLLQILQYGVCLENIQPHNIKSRGICGWILFFQIALVYQNSLWLKSKRNEDGIEMESVNDQRLQITEQCLWEQQE